jgi:starch synthase (maltosyl-transferring)
VPAPRAKQPPPRIQIERTEPVLDCGRYPAKRAVGEAVTVSADVVRVGDEVLRAAVLHRAPDA